MIVASLSENLDKTVNNEIGKGNVDTLHENMKIL